MNLQTRLTTYATIGTLALNNLIGCAAQKTFEYADSSNLLKTSKLFLDCRDAGYLSEQGIKRAQNIIDTGDNKQITILYNELYEIKTLSEKEGVAKADTFTSERVLVKKNYRLEAKTADVDTTQNAKKDSLLVKVCEETLNETWASTADKSDTTYVLNPKKAEDLGLKDNGDGYITTFATGYTPLESASKNTTKETEKRIPITQEPKSVKEIALYNQGFFKSKKTRWITGTILGIGIGYGISELTKGKSGKGDSNGTPEPPADVGVSGGRGEPISDSGSVRGGRNDDNSEVGGVRK